MNQITPNQQDQTPQMPPVDQTDQLAVHERWKFYVQTASERDLTPEETAEAIICTRILRRTNTGPAKAKEPRSKVERPKVNLLDD